jgi:methylated-DNA-[protein]-cysteine S-methyltransferase
MNYTAHYSSPIGGITLASDGAALTGLWFDGQKHFAATLAGAPFEKPDLPVFAETRHWLDLYFAGQCPDFTPPLAPTGTPFQQKVWNILLDIPYGKTTTYGEIAKRIVETFHETSLRPAHMSPQAVGGAVGRNPVSLIIPCHRVVGADGSLTGYAGGLERKSWLLRKERGW